MARKTFDVQKYKESVNKVLARPEEMVSEEVKMGYCMALEMVLQITDNYHGFNYVDWQNGGFKAWQEAGQPEDFEEKQKFIGREYSRKYY